MQDEVMYVDDAAVLLRRFPSDDAPLSKREMRSELTALREQVIRVERELKAERARREEARRLAQESSGEVERLRVELADARREPWEKVKERQESARREEEQRSRLDLLEQCGWDAEKAARAQIFWESGA